MRIEEVVGRRLRQAREEAGLTQEQLGQEMRKFLAKPWPGQQVSVAEDGRRKFTAEELFALCMILRRPASAFFVPFETDIEVSGTLDSVPLTWASAQMIWGAEREWNRAAPTLAALVGTFVRGLGAVETEARKAKEVAESINQILWGSKETEGAER